MKILFRMACFFIVLLLIISCFLGCRTKTRVSTNQNSTNQLTTIPTFYPPAVKRYSSSTDTVPTTIYKQKNTTVPNTTPSPTINISLQKNTTPQQSKIKNNNIHYIKNEKEITTTYYIDNITTTNEQVDTNTASDIIYTAAEFQVVGVIDWDNYQWTYYSELILPGYDLDIPGRHVNENGYICDKDGYIVLAADLDMLSRYTIIDTPFGRMGKIYDTGCGYGIIDVYVSW